MITQFDLLNISKARCLSNYKVFDLNVNNNECLVLFSSNGLYYPNDELNLDNVIKNDYYEWQNIYPVTKYAKVIFFRDVYKQWYVKGINKNVNDLDKLQSLIESLTKGFHCTFVGSSAGGWAALYFGSVLNVKRVITISGQFDLTDEFAKPKENPLLFSLENKVRLNISKSIGNIFYICPFYSEMDYFQYRTIVGNNSVKVIKLSSNIHGVPFFGFSCRKLLSASDRELYFFSFLSRFFVLNRYLFSFYFISFKDFVYKLKKTFDL